MDRKKSGGADRRHIPDRLTGVRVWRECTCVLLDLEIAYLFFNKIAGPIPNHRIIIKISKFSVNIRRVELDGRNSDGIQAILRQNNGCPLRYREVCLILIMKRYPSGPKCGMGT